MSAADASGGGSGKAQPGAPKPAQAGAPSRDEGSPRGSAHFETEGELRAANLVWNAAGDYSFSPWRLFLDESGEALLYENTATGLVRKWFDGEAVRGIARSWEKDFRAARLDDVLWLAFSEAAFARERDTRPALEELHGSFLRRLGDAGREALDLLNSPGPVAALGQAGIESRVRKALSALYRFDGRIVKSPDTALHLGVALLAPVLRDRAGGDARGRAVPAGASTSKGTGGAGARKGPVRRAREQHARERAAADRRAVQALFGPSLLSDDALEGLEAATCTGNHAGCRLWIADGGTFPGSARTREGREMLVAVQGQVERTAALFAKNRRLCESAADALAHRLRDRLDSDERIWERRRPHGSLDAARAWRAEAMDDARIFRQRERLDVANLEVWLLLDASGSRAEAASAIAVQAWTMARGLARAGMQVHVRSFCSMHGFTVIRDFDGKEGDGPAGALRYFACGMNRDGLALRVVGREARLRARSSGRRQLVVVLTDGAPMDDVPFPSGSAPGNAGREYVGRDAVRDAAEEVRALRAEGTGVAALFNGEDAMLEDCRVMYGTSYRRLRDLSHLADAAADAVAAEARRA